MLVMTLTFRTVCAIAAAVIAVIVGFGLFGLDPTDPERWLAVGVLATAVGLVVP
jgi:hypothetical protein